jgi:flagellar biosynthetic protein FliP
MVRLLLLVFIMVLTASSPAAAQIPDASSPSILGIDGGDTSLRQTIVSAISLVTLLSVAPSMMMMVTCFPFILIIFSFLKQALGLQTAPPTMMLTALALFLTLFIMDPVVSEAWREGALPYQEGRLDESEAFARAAEPFRQFMSTRTDEDTLFRLADALGRDPVTDQGTSLSLLVPSFMLSEITRAFEIGFALFLPFVIIDIVTAAVLMALGMMMVPPAVVSMPFKLAFFILADGWVRLTEALLLGYAV